MIKKKVSKIKKSKGQFEKAQIEEDSEDEDVDFEQEDMEQKEVVPTQKEPAKVVDNGSFQIFEKFDENLLENLRQKEEVMNLPDHRGSYATQIVIRG
jgi:hypothetical protein